MGELDRLLKISKRNLLPLPKVGRNILETLLSKTEREFLELIINNPELSSLILSMANQPRYRKDSPPIKDVKLALLILGEDITKILVLSFISTKLSKKTFNAFNFSLFWARAIANLCLSFVYSSQFEDFPPHLHISSYLMDFGIIVLYTLFPENYLKVLNLKKLGKPLCEAEKETFGVDHAIIGSEYFETYNFPRRFVLNLRYHHSFPNLPEEIPPQVFEDLKFMKFIDLGVSSHFSMNREKKFKEFKNFAESNFNLDEHQTKHLIDLLPELTNPFYEFLGYKDFLLTPCSELFKKVKEIKKQLQTREEKEDESLIESYQEELAKLTRLKELLIKENELLKKRIEEIAILDPLTGLYNERYFLNRLKEELLRAKRYSRLLSVLLIEIEKFSQIVELFGTEEEEIIIKILSQEILKNIRRVDIPIKLSNPEQFAIILPETSLSGAMVVARRLLRIIEKIFYQKYNIIFSPYIAVVSYNPLKLDPKTDPQIEHIINILKKGIDILKMRAQKKFLSFVIDKELELSQHNI